MSKTAFLSSTGADLRAYREAAFLAIQKLDGCGSSCAHTTSADGTALQCFGVVEDSTK